MKKIVGYYPEWAVYGAHENYAPSSIPFDKMTHVNYAFAIIKDGKIGIFDDWAATGIAFDEAWDSPYKGTLGQFKKLKASHPNTSFMVSVGGWTQSAAFHDVAATAEARELFAQSVVTYLRTWGFDGADIDWEYPGSAREPDLVDNPNDTGTPQGDASEKESFTLLLKDLRTALDQAGEADGQYYQLTAAVGASPQVIGQTEPVQYSQYLDFINLMTYDMHGAWDSQTNHQSPIYADDEISVDGIVRHFQALGVDKQKLVVGSPFYSRGWKGVTSTDSGLFSATTGGADGIWDGGRAAGVNPYYHIKSTLEADPEFVKYRDTNAKVPYLYSSSKGEFYTYEDEISLAEKTSYVEDNGLGGIIFWEITADAPVKGTSLLDVINEAFYGGGPILPPDDAIDQNTTDTGDDNTEEPPINASSWDAAAVYVAGDQVQYDGALYEAKWWTQGNVPGTEEWGPWTFITGEVTPPDDTGTTDGNTTTPDDDNTTVTPPDLGDYPAYVEGTGYAAGDVVTNNGGYYECKPWPATPWCASAATAYAPGAGHAWEDAWNIFTGTTTDDNTDSGEDNATDPTDTGTPVTDENGTYVISALSLAQQEAALTDSDLMRMVKESIRVRSNDEVDVITAGSTSNPTNVKRVEQSVSLSDWDHLFPERTQEYTYDNFLKAVGKFPSFCGDYDDGRDAETICKRSLSTMFAHFTQETGGHNDYSAIEQWRQGLVYVREVGWSEEMRDGYNGECDPNLWQGERWPCGTFEDGSFKSYFGRGAKQLSYNYNYGPFSEAMTGSVHTLMDHPELVADSWLNLASAVFFFVYPQPPKPSMLHVIDGTWQPNEHDITSGLVPGFGVTTQIINGGVECGGSVEVAASQNRISYFHSFSDHLGVNVPADEVLGCKSMLQFSSEGAGALPIYWEKDWGYDANTPNGETFKCQLVNYQTAHSAFIEGDYSKCVDANFDVVIE